MQYTRIGYTVAIVAEGKQLINKEIITMKRRILIVAMLVLALAMANVLVACGGGTTTGGTTTGSIDVVSREDGSGTRGAFEELIGLEGDKTLVSTAIVSNSTGAVKTLVGGTTGGNAIAYISLGSLDNTVKALTVDGVAATTANILSGDYAVARNLNLAVLTDAPANDLRDDFMTYVMSAEGQAICEDSGFIAAASDAAAYVAPTTAFTTTTLTISGSTSVYPAMEALVEAYKAIHTSVIITVSGTGSSSGMTAAIDGTSDIGMASRELKDSELTSLTPTVLAIDGIAVIVNNNNSFDNITMAQLLAIYSGETTTWDELA